MCTGQQSKKRELGNRGNSTRCACLREIAAVEGFHIGLQVIAKARRGHLFPCDTLQDQGLRLQPRRTNPIRQRPSVAPPSARRTGRGVTWCRAYRKDARHKLLQLRAKIVFQHAELALEFGLLHFLPRVREKEAGDVIVAFPQPAPHFLQFLWHVFPRGEKQSAAAVSAQRQLARQGGGETRTLGQPVDLAC